MKHETSFTRRPWSWFALPLSLLVVCTPAACSGSGHVEQDTETEIPTFVASPALTSPASLESTAAVFHTFHADPSELTVKREFTDALGDTHTRYTQFKNGLEVIGGELIVHRHAGAAGAAGVIYAANGSARADRAAPSAPVLSPARAIAAALEGRAGLVAEPSAPLAYYRSETADALALVYQVTVQGVAADGMPILDTVLVDAVNGAIVETLPRIYTAKYREVHNCAGSRPLPCPVARIEGQLPVADPIVNANYDVLGAVYDTYKQLFGRDSIDGVGGKLVSAVRYTSSNYMLTFWSGSQFVYTNGDGIQYSNPAPSFDLTGHEMTHVVIERTSGLLYTGQPGALNESLADIVGEVIEWYAHGKVVQPGTWQFAEDIYTPGTPGDAVRYLNDPKKDSYSLDFYPDYYSGIDVHYASGISNLAFYLLAQGGRHPRGRSTILVNGIGIEKAAKAFYRANDVYFTANTTFAQAKTSTARAAVDLGYTPAEVDSVKAAWSAVGVP